MTVPNIAICSEGLPAIFLCAFSALMFAVLEWWIPAILFWLGMVYSLWFFRDPERVVPIGEDLAVSPADGKIIRIEQRTDPFGDEKRVCISIFMNLFSVHVNRSPIEGKVIDILYFPGKFLNASFDKASTDNERCAILIEDFSGEKWCMVQIAGLVARRIVCRTEAGDVLGRGERVGMIRFGSRVDLYLPTGYVVSAKIGDYVYGGQTVLAHKA